MANDGKTTSGYGIANVANADVTCATATYATAHWSQMRRTMKTETNQRIARTKLVWLTPAATETSAQWEGGVSPSLSLFMPHICMRGLALCYAYAYTKAYTLSVLFAHIRPGESFLGVPSTHLYFHLLIRVGCAMRVYYYRQPTPVGLKNRCFPVEKHALFLKNIIKNLAVLITLFGFLGYKFLKSVVDFDVLYTGACGSSDSGLNGRSLAIVISHTKCSIPNFRVGHFVI